MKKKKKRENQMTVDEYAKKRNNEAQKRVREKRKSQQKCARCGKQDERTLAGKAMCQVCTDYSQKYKITPEHRKQAALQGICTRCRKRPAIVGKYCEVCATKKHLHYVEYNKD